MELSQFTNLVGLTLGVAGTLLLGRDMIDMKIEDIVKATTDLKTIGSSFNNACDKIRIRSYVMFGSAILFLSFMFQIFALFIPQGIRLAWWWSVPAIICTIRFTRWLDTHRQRGVRGNVLKAIKIYKDIQRR